MSPSRSQKQTRVKRQKVTSEKSDDFRQFVSSASDTNTAFSSGKQQTLIGGCNKNTATTHTTSLINQDTMLAHTLPQKLSSPPRVRTSTDTMSATKRRLVIKPLKSVPTLPDNYEADSMNRLNNAIEQILHGKTVDVSQEDLYRTVAVLCQQKCAETLFNNVYGQVKTRVTKWVSQLASLDTKLDDTALISAVEAEWVVLTKQLQSVRSIYLFLDRTYVINRPELNSLSDVYLNLLHIQLLEQHEFGSRISSAFLNLVRHERDGVPVNRSLLASILRMLHLVKLYKVWFENDMLDQTLQYYREESQRLVKEFSCSQYLVHVEQRLQEECLRVEHYMQSITLPPLIKHVEQQLIAAHVDTLLREGFDGLMVNKDISSLERLYKLLQRIEALSQLQSRFAEWVKHAITAIVQPVEKEPTMVKELLVLIDSIDSVLKNAFASNSDFIYSMKNSLDAALNSRLNKPAEYLAKYVSTLLRAGTKTCTSEDELEITLDKVMFIFRFCQGKDVFLAFYKKDLAKRLLLGKSASFDNEKLMIAKLKAECGASFTSKLEGMFKDIELSKDVQREFNEFVRSTPNPPTIELGVHVLTTGHWPAYNQIEMALPREVANMQERFKSFYLNKHNGRRLTWQNSLSTALLRASFNGSRKELAVSGTQAIVLCLFNDTDVLTFEQLKSMSRMDERELRLTLYTLAIDDKSPHILLKNPANKKLEPTDTFRVDVDFKSKLFRLTINQIQMRETKDEESKTTQKVFEDRQYAIDACLVRIMKSRKTMHHNLLCVECIQQCKFPIKMPDLKKRIGSLIEREYIERDNDDSQVYHYLA